MYPESLDGLHILGIYVHEPGGALSNLLMAIAGIGIYLASARMNTPFAERWRAFLLLLGLASLFGIASHGFPHLLGPDAFYLVWGFKNSLIPLANLYAAMACLAVVRPLVRVVLLMKMAIAIGALWYFGTFTPVAIDLGITYAIVIALCLTWSWYTPGIRFILPAFSIALFSGIFYVVKLDIHQHWLTHKDLVHVFVFVSMYLIYRAMKVNCKSVRNPAFDPLHGA